MTIQWVTGEDVAVGTISPSMDEATLRKISSRSGIAVDRSPCRHHRALSLDTGSHSRAGSIWMPAADAEALHPHCEFSAVLWLAAGVAIRLDAS